MTPASSSSSRKACEASGRALGMHVPVEIGGKSFTACGHARIVGEVRRVRAVVVGKPERPSAFRRYRDRVHVKAAERAGRERGIVEQVSLGGFNWSAQHLLILLDKEVADGDVTDIVHGEAEG